MNIAEEIRIAEAKAWDSLARYKFTMFGYWAGIWVHLNRIEGTKRPNPWASLVNVARSESRVARVAPVKRNKSEQLSL